MESSLCRSSSVDFSVGGQTPGAGGGGSSPEEANREQRRKVLFLQLKEDERNFKPDTRNRLKQRCEYRSIADVFVRLRTSSHVCACIRAKPGAMISC